ncbi:afadin isoform X5 [Atheta coriaria]|uniref:afadin isoform X5 n=1 Tax=Dalotia coriaria TaxID=877792 RepID=UPI0031F391CA
MLGFRSFKRLRNGGKCEILLGSSIMFHVRRRPADCAPRKRKKKPGSLSNNINIREQRIDTVPLLVELGPDGSPPHPGDSSKTLRLVNEVMEVGSANGIALQLYGPHIQPRHCVITNSDSVTSLTPCHTDAIIYVNGQRIYQTTILNHGSLIKFGNSNTYRFLDPSQEDFSRGPSMSDLHRASTYDRSPSHALSQNNENRENFETNFDLEGNVETISTTSGNRDDSTSRHYENKDTSSTMGYPRGSDPILPAVLEFPEEPQDQFLARVITHLDVHMPTFKLAPAYTLYLCARYRASTHYRPELTPNERAHKLTQLLHHAAVLVRHTVQDRSTDNNSQAFWLANASELLHFLKQDRHVGAFSIQAQDILADSVQLAFKNLLACFTDELNGVMAGFMTTIPEEHPNGIINVLSNAMNLLRRCRVNAALTIQLFSQLFNRIAAKALSIVINNPHLCCRAFGKVLGLRLRNLQVWAESLGLELAAECHLAKIIQCVQLLQGPKSTPEELASLPSTCFKLNSLQLRALLTQYKCEPGEIIASPQMLEQAARASEGVADELARAEGKEVRLHEDPSAPFQLLLPDDGYSCDVVQGVPAGLAEFLLPLQASGLCRLAAQPTSSGHWTVYMTSNRPTSAMSSSQPEIQIIKLHKTGGGMGLSIVAAKGAGQERLGIYIKSVVPGGAADRDGRLAAGDQLLSVDGHSLLGITQEKAAEFLVRTGGIVALEVAKGGAVYHGLATLLQQPSPTPNRGSRRMSERDLPSKVDTERTILSSKSVPALHHLSPGMENRLTQQHDVFNPGYSRTSSNNSINTTTNTANNGIRSRSTHNLHNHTNSSNQQDSSFYQNLSVYRNKMPISPMSPMSPPQLGDRTSALRSSQVSLQSNLIHQQNQRPTSACYTNNTAPHPAAVVPNRALHQSIPNLKHQAMQQSQRMHDANTSASYPNVNNHNQTMSPTYSNQEHHEPDAVRHMASYGNIPNYNSPSMSVRSQEPMSPTSSLKQPINVNIQQRQDEYSHYTGSGLLKERDDSNNYNNQNHIQRKLPLHHMQQQMQYHPDEYYRNDVGHQDIARYPSSGNIRNMHDAQHWEDKNSLRGQAKMAEMSEEVRRRHMMNKSQSSHELQLIQNTKSMQNLHLTHQQSVPPMIYNNYNNKFPPVAPKPSKKQEDLIPEPPPTSTHPLYMASTQDPPKMTYCPNPGVSKTARDPWIREEQEKQEQQRRELSRQWQEQQIKDLSLMAQRTQHQEEQLRVLQFEREFQRRAQEAAELDEDDNTEKGSPTMPPVKDTPLSILKSGVSVPKENDVSVPPPPERGVSYTIMSMRSKEGPKRVSFNDPSTAPQIPETLQLEERREDPNVFIKQAEMMLASPTHLNDGSPGVNTATPGVIGAQEVYRDPRQRRLAEQAQQKTQTQTPVPEKLTFKEKMKMFAMETGEQETPKDKSKISRAQREIDSIGSPNPSLVH